MPIDTTSGAVPCEQVSPAAQAPADMNGGTLPRPGQLSSAAPLRMAVHPDDQMYLDVFAQDMTQADIGAWPRDGLPPLDFGNRGSPDVEYPQARSCALGGCSGACSRVRSASCN